MGHILRKKIVHRLNGTHDQNSKVHEIVSQPVICQPNVICLTQKIIPQMCPLSCVYIDFFIESCLRSTCFYVTTPLTTLRSQNTEKWRILTPKSRLTDFLLVVWFWNCAETAQHVKIGLYRSLVEVRNRSGVPPTQKRVKLACLQRYKVLYW